MVRRPFLKGNPGGPGRPKGSRDKFGEDFVRAFVDDFRAHGSQAILKCRLTDVATYLRVAASLLPKELTVEHRGDVFGAILEAMDERRRSRAPMVGGMDIERNGGRPEPIRH